MIRFTVLPIILKVSVLINTQNVYAQMKGLEYFENEFPKIVCLKDDYLMSCFQIKQSVCELKVKELIGPCLEMIPKKAETKSKHLALGACIGNLFEKNNESLKLETRDCANPDKWK